MLASRLVSFYRGLIKSPKFSIRFLSRLAERDKRTVLGGTLEYLLKQCSVEEVELEKLTPILVKKRLVYARAPLGEECRNLLAVELMSISCRRFQLSRTRRNVCLHMHLIVWAAGEFFPSGVPSFSPT